MSGRRRVITIIDESLSQHDEKHVVPTPLCGIRVGRRRVAMTSQKFIEDTHSLSQV
jgi:hypothetical protein